MIGRFGEDAVKVFAAELGSALGKNREWINGKKDCKTIFGLQNILEMLFFGY